MNIGSLLRRFFSSPETKAQPEAPTTPEPTLLKVLVERLRLLPVQAGPAQSQSKITFMAELAALGYAVDNPGAYSDSVLIHYAEILGILRAMRGGNVPYVPLFQGFPDKVPDGDQYFVERVLGYLGNRCQLFDSGVRLETGMLIPEWLFDLKEFGADPILQMQDSKLFKAGLEAQKGRQSDSHTEWIHLRLADEEEIQTKALQWLHGNLYSRSSIQETLRPDLSMLLKLFPPEQIDPARVVFKETQTLLSRYFFLLGNYPGARRFCQTPTDVLRLMAALTGGDVSLAESITFPKLTRPQRRFILGVLESSTNLQDDLQRYRGLWIALARSIHVGEHKKQFPQAAGAIQALREGSLRSFNSPIEVGLTTGQIEPLLPLLKQRPGEFARRLHHLLDLACRQGAAAPILEAFTAVVDKITLKNLLVMQSFFTTIEDSPYRTVINKKGRIRVLNVGRRPLSPAVLEQLLELLEEAILNNLARRPSWAGRTVWVDQRLRNYTIPLQQRKASEGLLVLGRGSKIPLDMGKVLRLFVYWKEAKATTDLDLSVIQFGPELNYVGHVSYTRLKGEGVVHSGDIQSAPLGAAEFIDIDLGHLAKDRTCRYIAPQIHRYTGDLFGSMECHSGWMLRDTIDATYATFDIKTVQNKFDLTGNSGYAIPIIIDLWERQITFVDLYIGDVHQRNSVEGAIDDITIVTGEMVRMLKTRPNMLDLCLYHAKARGATLVPSQAEAELTFGLQDCTYNVTAIERILSELL